MANRHGLHTAMTITSQSVANIRYSATGASFILIYQGRMLIGDKALKRKWHLFRFQFGMKYEYVQRKRDLLLEGLCPHTKAAETLGRAFLFNE